MDVKNEILSIQDIPKPYAKLKENITNSFLSKIYMEKIKFKYFDFIDNHEKNESILALDYLNSNKFFTYQIVDLELYESIFTNSINTNEKKLSNLKNMIICSEDGCLIIENINDQIINSIFQKENAIFLKIDEFEINEEIKSVYTYYQNEIDSNPFLKYTYSPIICYLIRRFYYPTNYFRNPSFFKYQSKSDKKDFDETDFIILRSISSNNNKIFNLALHIESFYLFSIKTICQFYNLHSLDLETNFVTNFSHRCLTKFYGFLKNDTKIEGFVYEYMCNGTLYEYLQNNKNKISYFFSFISINRIFQGIYYLHSKYNIHRDLQPLNILIDHDYLTYISDFDTVIKVEKSDPNAYTQDVGSLCFCSYEQENAKSVSFQTDIYSFGVNLYLLFEQKEYQRGSKMTKFDLSFQKLYRKCIGIDINKRPDIPKINKILTNHLLTIDSLKYYFPIEKNNQRVQSTEMIQFYEENIHLLSLENNDINLKNYQKIFPDASQLICYLGNIFSEGRVVQQNFLKAREFYEISAQLNNSNALCIIGDIYRNGEGVGKNIVKAREYYELAAKENNADALDHLGNIYNFGQGVEKDYVKAKHYYELSAEQNNADALYSMGYYYYIGRVVEKDLNKAAEFYKKSAMQNNSLALNGLGNYYFLNPDIKENVEKGIECYDKAAKLNNSNAFLNLGNIYSKGNFFIKKDIGKSIYFYEKAAELENIDAYIALGNIYYLGNGVEKDFIKTIHYFTLAANKDNADANNFLGFLYDTGQGVPKNYTIARKYFEKAAYKNHPNALNNLGNIYLHGCDVAIDYLRAKFLFEKSSNLGNARAYFLLGNIYFEGLGVEKNYLEAIKNYKFAAEKGFSRAMYALGDIYYKGLGVEKDFSLSKKYYEEAHESKYLQASFQLGKMYYYGKGVSQNYEKAKEYFLISTGMNDINSFFYLGKMYEDGKGVEININKSIDNYLLCCGKKNEKAEVKYNQGWTYSFVENVHYYHAFNNLGLIHIILLENIELAEDYLKNAGLDQFPLGQNNLGLFNQFFNNNKIDDAKHFFSESASKKFSMPEFNLAYIEEKQKNIDKSIEHYLNVLEYENEPLIFHNTEIIDEYLFYSKIYIVCLTNLKLFKYFATNQKINDQFKSIAPRKFFINAIFRPIFYLLFNSKFSYSFKFVIDHNENTFKFRNLKKFFFDFPLFFNSMQNSEWNLIEYNGDEKKQIKKIVIEIEVNEGTNPIYSSQNENLNEVENEIETIYQSIIKNDNFQLIENYDQTRKSINDQIKIEKSNDEQKINYLDKNRILNYLYNNLCINQTKIIAFRSLNDSSICSLEYPLFLDEMLMQDLNQIVPQIDEIIDILNDNLYTYPYPILFGRIGKKAVKHEDNANKVDESFYDGFLINES